MKGILADTDKERIKAAIAAAEATTSGEIRVHVEPKCGGDPMDHAKKLFEEFGMTATRDRTGVLLYIAWKDHKLAVLGDSGIHEKVGASFWDGIVGQVVAAFKEERYGDGIANAVTEIGRRLTEHFPGKHDDTNELMNEVTEG